MDPCSRAALDAYTCERVYCHVVTAVRLGSSDVTARQPAEAERKWTRKRENDILREVPRRCFDD